MAIKIKCRERVNWSECEWKLTFIFLEEYRFYFNLPPLKVNEVFFMKRRVNGIWKCKSQKLYVRFEASAPITLLLFNVHQNFFYKNFFFTLFASLSSNRNNNNNVVSNRHNGPFDLWAICYVRLRQKSFVKKKSSSFFYFFLLIILKSDSPITLCDRWTWIIAIAGAEIDCNSLIYIISPSTNKCGHTNRFIVYLHSVYIVFLFLFYFIFLLLLVSHVYFAVFPSIWRNDLIALI